MNPHKYSDVITSTVEQLSEYESFKTLCHQHHDGEPMPSEKVLHEIIELCRSLIFPGYFGHSTINRRTISYYVGVGTERLFELLTEQILAGLCFACDRKKYTSLENMRESANEKSAEFIKSLPELRRLLATDVIAAYNGDRQRRVTEKSYFVTLQYGLSAITALLTVLFNWEYRLFLE